MSDMMKNILIVDEDVGITNYFNVFLMQTGEFNPEVENDSRRVEELLGKNDYDVLMLDLDMPHITGLEILMMMKENNFQVPVVILTGSSDVDLAERVMKYGAFEYLNKPVEEDHLLEVLDAAIEKGARKQ